MEKKRRFNWGIHLLALLITTGIFIAGILVGNTLQKNVVSSVESDLNEVNQRVLDVQLLLLTENTGYFCDIYEEKLPKLDEENYILGQTLEYLEEKKGVSNPDLKKQYFELELRDYLLMEKANEQCGLGIPILLYFYNNRDCKDCGEQGYEITKLRKDLGKEDKMLRVYTFDGGMSNQSAVVHALIKNLNITEYPTIVLIANNQTIILRGLHDKEEIRSNLDKMMRLSSTPNIINDSQP